MTAIDMTTDIIELVGHESGATHKLTSYEDTIYGKPHARDFWLHPREDGTFDLVDEDGETVGEPTTIAQAVEAAEDAWLALDELRYQDYQDGLL